MKLHDVRVHPEKNRLPKEEQLAWKIASVASDPVDVEPEVAEMIVNRVIDNAAVALASVNRRPVVPARDTWRWPTPGQMVRPSSAAARKCGCTRNGLPGRTGRQCASWTTTTRSSRRNTRIPGTTLPPPGGCPAVRARRAWLVRGLATGYEIQIDLVRAICLHEHKIDHVAHLGPSAAAGIGALLGLETDVIYQAVQQALHVTTATRQSRKGEISSPGKLMPPLMPVSWRSRRWTA